MNIEFKFSFPDWPVPLLYLQKNKATNFLWTIEKIEWNCSTNYRCLLDSGGTFSSLSARDQKVRIGVLKSFKCFCTLYATIFFPSFVGSRSFVRINVNLVIVMNFHEKLNLKRCQCNLCWKIKCWACWMLAWACFYIQCMRIKCALITHTWIKFSFMNTHLFVHQFLKCAILGKIQIEI